MCKGFICTLALLWVGNPLTLPLAGLAVFYKFLMVLILKAHSSYLPGLIKWAWKWRQMWHLQWAFQPLDLEEFFWGFLLSKGKNCCIIHGRYFHCKLLSHDYRIHTFPPRFPPPAPLPFHVSCSFAKVRCASLKSSGRKYPVRTRTRAPRAPTTSGVSDEGGSPPFSAYAFGPISNGADFTFMFKRKIHPFISPHW